VQHYFLFIKYGFHNIGLEEKLVKLPKSNKTAKDKECKDKPNAAVPSHVCVEEEKKPGEKQQNKQSRNRIGRIMSNLPMAISIFIPVGIPFHLTLFFRRLF